MHFPVLAATVHGEGQLLQVSEPSISQMLTDVHRSNYLSEDGELLLLAAHQRFSFEERDDLCQEVVPPAHNEHQRGVACAAMVLPDVSTVQTPADEVQDLSPLCVLADVELRYELPTQPSARIALNSNMKRTLAVDETGDVGIQPFLLIDRTRCIVTAHVRTLDMGSDKNE